LVRMCFQAFVSFHSEYQLNKEIEDMTKAKEQQIKEFLKTRGEGQFNVIRRLCDSTAAGLITGVFQEWVKWTADEKDEHKKQEEIEERMAKLGLFGTKNKGSAMKACDRLATIMEVGCLLVTVHTWKKWAKLERIRRYGSEKNSKKKAQLKGVKDLFRGFAQELEGGLKDGTPRIEPAPKR